MITVQNAGTSACVNPVASTPEATTNTFEKLGLSAPVMQGLRAIGFEKPTPIQERAIPILLQGSDLIGSAQTGTGKTAAFALPVLSLLQKPENHPRALILVPTRELACQVDQSIQEFARFTCLRTGLLYGGVGYGLQLSALRRGVDIVIATPGRLLDHIERGNVNLRKVQFLVLDEADRMLDMGFLPDVRRIISHIPSARQTALFSATIPPQIDSLIKGTMRSPRVIEIGERRSPSENVRHALYPVADAQKAELLRELLRQPGFRSGIIFCRTRHRVDSVARTLTKHNHQVAVIHSDRSQRERERALDGFRAGKFQILVATDIAARGIDIEDVSHVINYDVPHHPEDYVHRIGRTGRAEAQGDAFTLMVAEDATHVRAIERFIGCKITHQKIDKFSYQYTRLFDAPKPGEKAFTGKARGGRHYGGYSFAPGRARR